MSAQLIPNTPEWLLERKKHIGASEAPAIMGVSNYNSPCDIWLSKQDGYEACEQNEVMRRGHVLENPIALAAARMMCLELSPSKFVIHPEHSFMSATPDAMVTSDSGNNEVFEHLQIKTHDAWIKGDYGESGTSEIPVAEYIQVQHEIAVTGNDMAYLVVLLASKEIMQLMVAMIDSGVTDEVISIQIEQMDLRWFPVHRNLTFEADLIETERQWWETYIIGGERPSDIRTVRPKDKVCRNATSEELEVLATLKGEWINLEQAKHHLEKQKEILKSLVGEDYGIINQATGEKVTWGKNKDTLVTVTAWEALCKAVLATMPEAEAEKLLADYTHTHEKEGSRTFRLPSRNWKKEV